LKAPAARGTVSDVQRSFSLLLLAAALFFGLVPACSPSKSAPAPDNGVNDVRQACEIRNTWTMRGVMRCTDCLAAAPLASCNCEQFKDFAGLCLEQGDARRADPSCTVDLDNCANLCAKTDCACIEACYASSVSCKQHTAARDGCVVDVCSQYCK
jgi:hypothetical protein